MEITKYEVKVIIPSNGHTLTQANEVNIEDRILSKKVYLAINDNPSNWVEITDDEALIIEGEQEKIKIEKEKENDILQQ